MKFADPNCPGCGEPATGTADFCPATARLDYDPETGEFEHNGSTEFHYDGQVNEVDVEGATFKAYGVDVPESLSNDDTVRLSCLDCGEIWDTEEIAD